MGDDTKSYINSLVRDNKKVRFVSYREGHFIYSCEDGFQFTVPLSDLGTSTLLNEDKALLFLRYIRKQIEINQTETE